MLNLFTKRGHGSKGTTTYPSSLPPANPTDTVIKGL